MEVSTALRWVGLTVVLVAVVGGLTVYAAATLSSDVPVSVALGGDVDETARLDREAIERRIHDMVNRERVEHDRERLRFDATLRRVARNHSHRMSTSGVVSHRWPDGTTTADRYGRFGVTCPAKGENVHYERIRTAFVLGGFGLQKRLNDTVVAAEVVDGWRSSRAHHENLLRSDWDRQGIGIVLLDTGPFLEVYATENFCGSSVSITVTPGD